ncbi:MAG: tetratricopeptide repeat protein [Anaerolineales bacterium]|nr:tetratricopeptide repeat protein [Anaerolineales bacterium]
MNRRKRRPNYFSLALLILIVLFGYYFNQIYLPTQPNPFEPTPTPTRSPESFVTEAQALFAEGKLLPAVVAYQQAINSSPQDSSLYVSLARTQVFAGQYEEAQKNAENALLLNSNNALAYGVHAWALDFQGKNSEAQASIQEALRLDPNNALIHAYYVEILINTGFEGYEKAAEESRVALALNPDLVETRRARALILEATGNYEEAIAEYQAAININPNISSLYIGLGLNYRILQVYDKAVEAFTRANALNPSDPFPDLYISRTYATIGEYAKSLQYAETAVQDRPDDASLRGNLGVMYYRNFYWPEAIQQLGYTIYGGVTEEGVEIEGIPLVNDIRVAEYYYTYGLALARTNQCGEALQIAQMIQSRVPADENAQFAASEIIRICEEALVNPPANTPLPTGVATPAVTSTP